MALADVGVRRHPNNLDGSEREREILEILSRTTSSSGSIQLLSKKRGRAGNPANTPRRNSCFVRSKIFQPEKARSSLRQSWNLKEGLVAPGKIHTLSGFVPDNIQMVLGTSTQYKTSDVTAWPPPVTRTSRDRVSSRETFHDGPHCVHNDMSFQAVQGHPSLAIPFPVEAVGVCYLKQRGSFSTNKPTQCVHTWVC